VSIHNFLIQFAVLYAPLMHPPTEQITPFLSRGPDPKMAEICALHDQGVKTIISLRTNSEKKKQRLCEKLGMKWIQIKTGVFMTPSPDQFDQFRAIVNNSTNYPIYTACEINMDRTAVYIAAWRRADQHWTAQQISDELHQHHMKTWWPIFRKYERVVNAYADKQDTVNNVATTETLVPAVSERAPSDADAMQR
jgi:protein tyrosine phosphatase (PTP) superfamily phosphohydrolase (DUF442 family)